MALELAAHSPGMMTACCDSFSSTVCAASSVEVLTWGGAFRVCFCKALPITPPPPFAPELRVYALIGSHCAGRTWRPGSQGWAVGLPRRSDRYSPKLAASSSFCIVAVYRVYSWGPACFIQRLFGNLISNVRTLTRIHCSSVSPLLPGFNCTI